MNGKLARRAFCPQKLGVQLTCLRAERSAESCDGQELFNRTGGRYADPGREEGRLWAKSRPGDGCEPTHPPAGVSPGGFFTHLRVTKRKTRKSVSFFLVREEGRLRPKSRALRGWPPTHLAAARRRTGKFFTHPRTAKKKQPKGCFFFGARGGTRTLTCVMHTRT